MVILWDLSLYVQAYARYCSASQYYIWLERLPTWEPELKARKQASRMPPPRAARGTECPGMSLGDPSGLNLPFRGPMMIQLTRAQVPPVRWTTPLPAKSRNPSSKSHPGELLSQTQWLTTGYTHPKTQNEHIRQINVNNRMIATHFKDNVMNIRYV